MAFRSVLIQWRARDVVADTTSDSDLDPDANPLPAGTKITITPAPSEVTDPSSDPPVTYYPQPIPCGFDADGDLYDPVNGTKGIRIIDPTDSTLQPHDWSLTIRVDIPSRSAKTYSARLTTPEPDGSYYLTRNMPTPAYTGTATSAAEYATQAAASATAAAASAASIDPASYVSAHDASGPLPASFVTNGAYARSAPAPSGETFIQALCSDPNNTGYMWAFGITSAKIGYTTDHGATFTPVIASPNPGTTIVQARISANFMWLLISAGTSQSGQLWRSPAPDSTGSNLVWTKVFDLTGLVNGPGGAAGSGPVNSCFRTACFDIQPDESHAYLLTYGGGNGTVNLGSNSTGIMAAGSNILYIPAGWSSFIGCIQGAQITVAGAGAAGATLSTTVSNVYSTQQVTLAACAQTSVSGATVTLPSQTYGSQNIISGAFAYVCANPGAASPTWSVGQHWAYSRHGHAVKIIGGVPWVSLGDYPYPTPVGQAEPPVSHVGVWAATTAAGTSWGAVSYATSSASPYDMINIMPATINGTPVVVGESDSRLMPGPLLIANQSGTYMPARPLCTMRGPFVQTMRSMSVTPEGNLLWYGTGENGAVGPVDAVWIAAPPFDRAFVLETLALNTVTETYEAVTDGAYTWIGNNRITRPTFR